MGGGAAALRKRFAHVPPGLRCPRSALLGRRLALQSQRKSASPRRNRRPLQEPFSRKHLGEEGVGLGGAGSQGLEQSQRSFSDAMAKTGFCKATAHFILRLGVLTSAIK